MELPGEVITPHFGDPHPSLHSSDGSRLMANERTDIHFFIPTPLKSGISGAPAALNFQDVFTKIDCADVHEEGIRPGLEFLSVHSRTHGADFAQLLPYKSLLSLYCRSCDLTTRSHISQILANVSSSSSPPREFLRDLMNAVKTRFDSESPKNLQIVLCNLLIVETKKEIDVEEALNYICESLFNSDEDIQIRIISTLSKLSQFPVFAEFFISQIDFANLIERIANPEVHSRVMKFMLNLLPSSRVLEPLGVPKCEKCALSINFAVKIQDSLAKSFVERPLAINWTLLAFAATLVSQPIQMSNEVVMALLGFATVVNIAPCVLGVLTFFAGKNQDEFCSRILEELEKVKPPSAIEKWYQAGLIHVRRKIKWHPRMDYSNWTMQEFENAAAEKRLNWFSFLTGGGIERCRCLLDQQKQGNFVEIVKFCSELLSLCPFPKNCGPSSVQESLRCLLAERTVNVQLPSNQTVQIRAPLYAPISLIEGLLNAHQFAFDHSRIISALAEQHFEPFIAIPEQLTASQISALGRGTCHDFQAFEFSVDSRIYTINDTMLSLVCDNFERSEIPTLIASRKDPSKHVQQLPKLRQFQSQFFDKLLEFLNNSALQFSLRFPNSKFISRVKNVMQFPLNSIGRVSPVFTLVFQYPQLFPYDLRLLAFRLCAMDPLSGLSRLAAEFSPSDSTLLPDQIGIPFTISRDRIAIDGVEFLKRFAANKLPLNLRFEGERGTGPGVHREFFTLLSQTFKDNQSIWRHNQSSGLFPSPVADAEIFANIGLLVAKALSMDCLLELPFSSAFIAMIRREEIKISEVDPDLAHVLHGEIDGVEFTCPGYPEVFERIGEFVNRENRNEFRDLVEKSVVGDRIKQCAEAFRTGFQRVIPLELLDVFSKDEIVGLIAGKSAVLTTDEFELNGYEKNHQTVVALNEVFGEFTYQEMCEFVLFVTGAKLLPVGGVKALHPKPGIWKMEKEGISSDDLLPSSLVCVNALKLPPYSSKQQLRSKILLAMSDGKDSFFLD